MTDLLDSPLQSAGRVPSDDPEVTAALMALVADRTPRARRSRRRALIPVLSFSLALGLLGTGAAVASQWGPWTYVTDPDITISRDWVDVTGASLGTCESRLAADALTDAQRAEVRDYLAGLDIDTLAPDTEYVATLLSAVGRPDDLGRLVAGARVEDYDITTTGPLWDESVWTDARVLQAGLLQSVVLSMNDESTLSGSASADGLSSRMETQCSTDPITPSAP